MKSNNDHQDQSDTNCTIFNYSIISISHLPALQNACTSTEVTVLITCLVVLQFLRGPRFSLYVTNIIQP